MKGFKVYQIDTSAGMVPACSRHDLCSIYLLTGYHGLPLSDQEMERDGTCLIVGNPPRVDGSEWVVTRQMGYACRFTEAFVRESGQTEERAPWGLLQGNKPAVFWLREEQAAYLTSLFELMLTEQQTDYRFKDELVRSYLQLVLHEAMRLRAPAPKRSFRYYFLVHGRLCVGKGSRGRCRPNDTTNH